MMQTFARRSTCLFACVALAAAIGCAGANDPDAVDNLDPNDNEADITVDVETEAPERPGATVSCEMDFIMEGWSAIVSKAEGTGTVTCDNGQTERVALEVTGGGLTVGKTTIDDGHGTFSDVTGINEVFGSYAQAEAHAGAVESASAQVLTKGEVSLAITAEGRGWSLGVSGAKFEIRRAADTTSS